MVQFRTTAKKTSAAFVKTMGAARRHTDMAFACFGFGSGLTAIVCPACSVFFYWSRIF